MVQRNNQYRTVENFPIKIKMHKQSTKKDLFKSGKKQLYFSIRFSFNLNSKNTKIILKMSLQEKKNYDRSILSTKQFSDITK